MNSPGVQRNRARARELYGGNPFGDFCYGDARARHNQPLVAFIKSIAADDRVFDIGAGTGYWLAHCRAGLRSAENATGVEFDAALAAGLRRKGLIAVCGDALALGIASNSADVTIANGVIHHTSDPCQAFAELMRITRPGGRVFVAVYNRWNPWFYLVHRAMWPLRFAYWNITPRVLDGMMPLMRLVYQPLARRVLGEALDDATARTLILDQVFTPYAHLFTKRSLRAYARRNGCRLEAIAYTGDFMMLTGVFVKEG